MMLRIRILAAVLLAPSTLAFAQSPAAGSAPGKTVRIVVPFPVGGPADTNARILGAKLSERWGLQVVVDPRPGGNTVIGTDLVAKSAPNGQTLLLTSTAYTVAPVIQAVLPYDPYADLAPVTIVSVSPQALVAHPSFPAANVQELIALARARPGQLNLANVDPSTMMAGHLFAMLANVKIEAVPYNGAAPMLIDLVGGQVTLAIASISAVQAQVRSGRVRLLGVGSETGTPIFPDAQVIAQEVPGFEAVAWFGLFAPGKMPKEAVTRLHRDVAAVLQMPDVKQRLLDIGGEPGGQTPEEFDARIRAEIARWIKVARVAGIKAQ
jgi:tripartite-type tricarboxylate transporter receptor subunit TctC